MTVLEIAGLVLVGIPLALLWLAAGFSVLCLAFSPVPRGALTVEQLVQRCEGLSGWALVERAQREVHAAMPGYGFCNGFDTPRQALARRRGICWHRAAVLASVLRAHGIEVRPVHAFLNRFETGLVSGHAWLEVRIPGEVGVRTVCPDEATNTPGVARFKPITRVRSFGPAMVALSWLGSPIANLFIGPMQVARTGSLSADAIDHVTSEGSLISTRERITKSALLPLVPILAWNAALASRLPPAFFDDHAVPEVVLAAELAGRLFVFGLASVLVLGLKAPWQRRGLALFVVGAVVYALSWLVPLFDPLPSWLWILPYALPILWLFGLGLMARSGGYLVGATLFSVAHVTHGVCALAARMP